MLDKAFDECFSSSPASSEKAQKDMVKGRWITLA